MERKTRLSRWLLLRQGLVMLAAAALLWGLTWSVVGNGFASIERDRMQELLRRSAELLRSSAQSLQATTYDYAAWDDSYSFVTAGNAEYLEQNYSQDSTANLGVDWVAFVNAKAGSLHGFRAGDEHHGQALEPSFAAAVAKLIAGLDARPQGKTVATVLWLHEEPILVTCARITDTARLNDSGSWLVLARRMAVVRPGHSDWTLMLPMRIQPGPATSAASMEIHQEGGDWLGRLPLAPWPAVLELRQAPAFAAQRRSVLVGLGLSLTGLATLAIFGVAVLLREKVLLRLERFAALADASSAESQEAVRWPVAGDDELDTLASALNSMMGRIEQQEADLAYLAMHDPLTNLGNRRQLMACLRRAVEQRAGEDADTTCLLLVDLDRFKAINDAMGHSAGDSVLATVAERLLASIRPGDLAVRLGGDEFAIVLSHINRDDVGRFCERLLVRLAHSMPYNDRLLSTTATIGVAWVEKGLTENDLLRRADRAMYRAKQQGRNRALSFDAWLDG